MQEDELTRLDLLTEALYIGLLVGCSACTALFAGRIHDQEAEGANLRLELGRLLDRDRAWRTGMDEHFRAIGTAIQQQFAGWGFSPAEKEIGFLLLKGFSHKEIARLRGSAEATIRQQAAALYQKAGLSGRAALSAYFLEDLIAPTSAPIDSAPSWVRHLNGPSDSLPNQRP